MIGIVTGASSGMGELFVESLLRRYPKLDEIWVIARRQARLAALEARYPGKIRPVVMDVSKECETGTLQKLLEAEKPNVKFLINAAGMGLLGEFCDLPLEELSAMTQVNMQGLTAITHRVLPYMTRNSRILMVSSVAGFMPQPFFSLYAASKAYVLSFGRALSYELRNRDIYVTVVCPGPMPTEFFDVAEKYGKGNLSNFKKNFMYIPEKVVEHALDAAIHKQPVATYGLAMKALWIGTKLLPIDCMLKGMMWMMPNDKGE